MEQLPVMRTLLNEDELEQLVQAAARDNHLVLSPTFVIEKAGEIVGYIGLNSSPTFQGWFDTQRISARDSRLIFNQLENLCRMKHGTPGWDHLLLLLPTTSPFRDAMQRFGYQHLADAGLWLKQLQTVTARVSVANRKS